MQTRFESEPLQNEARFYPETVQKAVALAQRLEQERRETLSLEQVNQLAEELHLDPQVLRQALARVSAEEANQAQVHSQAATWARSRQTRRAQIMLIIALLLAFPLLLAGYFFTRAETVPLTPPRPVVVHGEGGPTVAVPVGTPRAAPTPSGVPSPRLHVK